jgi:hypothetical protein
MCQRDYRDYKKRQLSQSASGRGIPIAATSSPGTAIHTALANISANEWDEVWIWAVNTSASAVKLSIEWGDTQSSDLIEVSIPGESGLVQVIPGLVLNNSKSVTAFAATADVVILHGYVHRYEQIDR